jgi:hypothetical protein
MSDPTIYDTYEAYVAGCKDNGELPVSRDVWLLWKRQDARIAALEQFQAALTGDGR